MAVTIFFFQSLFPLIHPKMKGIQLYLIKIIKRLDVFTFILAWIINIHHIIFIGITKFLNEQIIQREFNLKCSR